KPASYAYLEYQLTSCSSRFSSDGLLTRDIRISFTACACGDREPRADIFNDSGKLMDGVVMRAIQPFAALHSERAADSGRTVTPMPLAMAAVSVEMESISPIIFAVRRRSENASSTRTRTAL